MLLPALSFRLRLLQMCTSLWMVNLLETQGTTSGASWHLCTGVSSSLGYRSDDKMSQLALQGASKCLARLSSLGSITSLSLLCSTESEMRTQLTINLCQRVLSLLFCPLVYWQVWFHFSRTWKWFHENTKPKEWNWNVSAVESAK